LVLPIRIVKPTPTAAVEPSSLAARLVAPAKVRTAAADAIAPLPRTGTVSAITNRMGRSRWRWADSMA